MENILVSSCIYGNNTKYNGLNNYNPLIEKIKKKYNVILICPEVMGGLSTPRNPSEIKENKVYSNTGVDVTKEYNKGAQIALELAKKYNITKAILKESSPSCGSNLIYDGSFSGKKINGMGITARLLVENGIEIYNENQIEELL